MEPARRLGSDQRIRRQKTFKLLVEKGQFSRGKFFYLWVSRRSEAENKALKKKPMIGIVVSKKTSPRAVERNAWKRCVREIFRAQQEHLSPEAVCLVKVRSAQQKPPFEVAEKDLVELFKKAGAWA